jgi:hypothetical protein
MARMMGQRTERILLHTVARMSVRNTVYHNRHHNYDAMHTARIRRHHNHHPSQHQHRMAMR